MTKNLTEKQQKFMAVLFDEAGGDVVSAKKLAGYSEGTATSDILKALKDEIADGTLTDGELKRYFSKWVKK